MENKDSQVEAQPENVDEINPVQKKVGNKISGIRHLIGGVVLAVGLIGSTYLKDAANYVRKNYASQELSPREKEAMAVAGKFNQAARNLRTMKAQIRSKADAQNFLLQANRFAMIMEYFVSRNTGLRIQEKENEIFSRTDSDILIDKSMQLVDPELFEEGDSTKFISCTELHNLKVDLAIRLSQEFREHHKEIQNALVEAEYKSKNPRRLSVEGVKAEVKDLMRPLTQGKSNSGIN